METTTTFSIQGMSCGHCARTIETSVGKLKGVRAVKVDLPGAKAEVSYEPQEITPERIAATIRDEGYETAAPAGRPG